MKLGSNSIGPRHVIDTAIDWEEIGKRWLFGLFEKSGCFQAALFQEVAPESCSTSSSSSGYYFLSIFFLLRKVMCSFRRIFDRKRSTIQWMKETQLQL